MLQTINLVCVTLNLYQRLLQNYWKITVSKNSNKNHIAVSPPAVAEGKKLLLVLDLRHVNKHIQYNKFRYEKLSTLSVRRSDIFDLTFDLTSGYHHIEIHPEHRKFLGFEWTFEEGSTRYFQFCVLPFGLASACYVFTKALRPFTKRWRGRGIEAIIYIDDGIAAFRGFEIAKSVSELVRNDILSAG